MTYRGTIQHGVVVPEGDAPPDGTVVDVTVLLRPSRHTPPATPPHERLAAFDALQQSLNLDAAAAREWARRVRDERHAGR